MDRVDITAGMTMTGLNTGIIDEWTDNEDTDMEKEVGHWLTVTIELHFMIEKGIITDISTVTDSFLKMSFTDTTGTIPIKTG